MAWKHIAAAAGKFVSDNSPSILTGLGVAGAVTTTVLAAQAGFRTSRILDTELDYRKSINAELGLESKEKIQMVWKEFIPAGIAGVATVTAIIAANRVGSRRAAAIAAAFKISEQMSEEYKKRVVDAIGKKAEENIQTKLAEDRIARTPGHEVIIISGSKAIFFDEFAGRYFESDIETVRQAVNQVNHRVNNFYYASLTDFYDMLDLEKTEVSDEFGWNSDSLLEVNFSAVMMKDGRPAISMRYNKTPIHSFDRVH